MFCPNCGTKLPDGVIFCINCGSKIGGKIEAPVNQAPVPAVPDFTEPKVPEAAPVPVFAPEAPDSRDFKVPEVPPVPADAPDFNEVTAPEPPTEVRTPIYEPFPGGTQAPQQPVYPRQEAPQQPVYPRQEAPQQPVYPRQEAPQQPIYPQQPVQQGSEAPEPPAKPTPRKPVVRKRFSVGSMVMLCFSALLLAAAALLFFLMKTVRVDFEVITQSNKYLPWNAFKLTDIGTGSTLMKLLPYAIPGCLALGALLLLLSGTGLIRSKITCILGFFFGLAGVAGFGVFWFMIYKATAGTGWIDFLPTQSGWTEDWFRANSVAPVTTTMPAMPFGWAALGCAGLGSLFALIACFIPMKKK